MHMITFYIALGWLGLLSCALLFRVLRTHSPTRRILAIDTLSLLLIAFLGILATEEERGFPLDVALLLVLLGFAGTLAAARYYGEGHVLE